MPSPGSGCLSVPPHLLMSAFSCLLVRHTGLSSCSVGWNAYIVPEAGKGGRMGRLAGGRTLQPARHFSARAEKSAARLDGSKESAEVSRRLLVGVLQFLLHRRRGLASLLTLCHQEVIQVVGAAGAVH